PRAPVEMVPRDQVEGCAGVDDGPSHRARDGVSIPLPIRGRRLRDEGLITTPNCWARNASASAVPEGVHAVQSRVPYREEGGPPCAESSRGSGHLPWYSQRLYRGLFRNW